MDEDRISAAIERNARAVDDIREALRQINMRSERVMRELIKEISEQRGEIRAQTEAIRAILDRWGEGPTPAS